MGAQGEAITVPMRHRPRSKSRLPSPHRALILHPPAELFTPGLSGLEVCRDGRPRNAFQDGAKS